MTQQRYSAAEPRKTALSSAQPFPPSSTFRGLAQRRRWLVVDFDGTCTAHDTTPLLPHLAALGSRIGRMVDQEAMGAHQIDLQQRLSRFQHLEHEYMRLYGEAKAALLPTGEAGDEQERSMHDVLDALDKPSVTVTQLVSDSGVLRGLGHLSARELEGMLQLHGVSTAAADDDATVAGVDVSGEEVESGGERQMGEADETHVEDKVLVRLRHGCDSTLARILVGDDDEHEEGEGAPPSPAGWNLAVLSINWCPALIGAALVRPVLRTRRRLLRVDAGAPEIPIWSNGVDGDGVVTLHVPGASAKRKRIVELRRQILEAGEEGQRQESVIVYIGDSATDLAALLAADVGIVMGASGTMTALAARYGIPIVPFEQRRQQGFGTGNDRSMDKDDAKHSRKRQPLWQVESWQEVDELLLELDGCS